MRRPARRPALPALLRGPGDGVDGARLVSADGHPQHLVAVYRAGALARALAALPETHGAAMRRLVADLRLVDVPDTGDAAADADTWADVARLDAELGDRIGP